MIRNLSLFAALALTIGGGLLQGRLIGRWSNATASMEAAEKISRLPMNIGSWNGLSQDLGEAGLRRAGIVGYVARTYREEHTGEAYTILLVCGSAGPISTHTPEVCYPGMGYEAQDQPKPRSLPQDLTDSETSAVFFDCRFARPGANAGSTLQILWSWSGDGTCWEVSQNPRLKFAKYASLYKVYVIRECPAEATDRSFAEFLGLLIPVLQSALS